MDSTDAERTAEVGGLSPEHFRYLRFYAAATLGLLVLLGAWSGREMKESQQFQWLYHYQLDKLANLRVPAATVFVGDSSLGNAIDANVFGELAHAPAINLALTGSYGYAGSYNMLRRVLRRFTPHNVVIMHTADMMQRESDDLAYLMSADDTGFSLPTWSSLPFLATAGLEYLRLIYNVNVLKSNVSYALSATPPDNDWRYDYIAQRPQLTVTAKLVAEQSLAPGTNPDKPRFLRAIAELCRSERLNCVYVYGPLLQDICAASGYYLAQAAQAVLASGLRVAGKQACLPAAMIGDTIDHVGPKFKADSTRFYYRVLAPLLQ
jgi:hypothetical protein